MILSAQRSLSLDHVVLHHSEVILQSWLLSAILDRDSQGRPPNESIVSASSLPTHFFYQIS
jgi:hypothetical protein